MPKCSYCGKDYESFLGMQVVDSSTGKVSYFCSSKCRKNSEMRRKKKKWAKKRKEE